MKGAGRAMTGVGDRTLPRRCEVQPVVADTLLLQAVRMALAGLLARHDVPALRVAVVNRPPPAPKC